MPFNSSFGKILIVDDDPNIIELLTVNLRCEGYEVQAMTGAAEAARADMGSTSLIIADAMRQAFNGLDLLRAVKASPATQHVSVIITAGGANSIDVIDALDAGADDFIQKPFSLRELVARVRAVMRRHSGAVRPAAAPALTHRDISAQLTTGVVTVGGMDVTLTKTEFAILVLLLKSIGTPISRRAIFDEVWHDAPDVNNERIVDTNISRLRRKLGDAGTYIQNRTGLGYMLV